MKKKYFPTPEQIAKREKIRNLCKQIAAMPPNQRAALAAQAGNNILTCEGHHLSEHNCALIASQGGTDCTIVGGFVQWKAHGRQVNKGEHGFAIYVPCNRKKEPTGNTEGDEDNTYFITVSVFDVSQTSEIQTIQATEAPAIQLQKAA